MSKHIVSDIHPTVVLESIPQWDNRTLIDKTPPSDGAIVDHYDLVQKVVLFIARGDGGYERMELTRFDFDTIATAIREVEAQTFEAQYSSLPF